jgi:hypothetical protein
MHDLIPQVAEITKRLLECVGLLTRSSVSEFSRSAHWGCTITDARKLKSPTVNTLFRICDALDVSAVTIIKKVDAARKRKSSKSDLDGAGKDKVHCTSLDQMTLSQGLAGLLR